jgi:beta-N-acetylhexosaminidase
LIDQIQRNKYISSQQAREDPITGESFQPVFIPLFIATSQDGDGYPYDQILNGVTTLPSHMSLGATWQPGLAHEVGVVLGTELSGLGFNMLLGPSLDVLVTSPPESTGDLGTRSFGGDPFWVGEMGRAFIVGVHTGSNNQMAVIAKHFPGFGGSDRLPQDEVATVRKSLEQLKQIELAPFFAVTGNAPSTQATADGLLTSHIRYQGFQGNIRATTRPVSFDPQAFSQLMGLPEFSTWHTSGGVMVSDSLGSRAVRRFYDPTGQTFNSRLVALDAFLAGNDLLYLDDFTSSGDLDSYTSIVQTINFFVQKYREDDAFARRVDESVLRILTLKYRLYGDTFTLAETTPVQSALNQIGNFDQTTFDVAQEAATLVEPPPDELDDIIPNPPGPSDQIVFVSDSRTFQQCGNCREQFTLGIDDMEEAVVRLYSPSGQVVPGFLTSYSFVDLQDMLDAGTGVLQIENDLRQADWLVFLLMDISSEIPSSMALVNLLDQRPDLLQDKRVIVFAMNAPYYLDATDISKITAYYSLSSKSGKFIDIAARLLFQELQPNGALPVSVPGVGYDINEATFPDPNQIIPLFFDYPPLEGGDNLTPAPTPTLQPFRIGDTIPLVTGVIYDHNLHPVPDKTIVRFLLTYNGDTVPSQQVEAQTVQGIARAVMRIDRSGSLRSGLRVSLCIVSDILTMDIPPENITVTVPPPTETPTPTHSPTIMPSLTPTATLTPSPTPTPEASPQTDLGDWFLSFITIGIVSGLYYWLAITLGQLRWGIRACFLAIIAGLLTYSYLALDMPGSARIIQEAGSFGVLLCVLLGSMIGGGLVWLWRLIQKQKKNRWLISLSHNQAEINNPAAVHIRICSEELRISPGTFASMSIGKEVGQAESSLQREPDGILNVLRSFIRM